ncbi:MAG TPA: DUF998 domain-containing protein, partial [Anaerolineae bacterium]|nr:DUF998 domain-containing protein [Anaerolineae bacterium]
MSRSNPDNTKELIQITTRNLLLCGLIAGPLFVITLRIEGALTPDYNALRHPGSSLALGPFGWVQDINFIVAGILTLAFTIGVRRALKQSKGPTWGWLLIGYWSI